MKDGIHEISRGSRFRQCVEIVTVGKKKRSRTFHQEFVDGKWVARRPKR